MNKQANIRGVWHGVGIQTPKEAHERSSVVPKGENVLFLTSIDSEEFEKQFMCEWNPQAKDEVGGVKSSESQVLGHRPPTHL